MFLFEMIILILSKESPEKFLITKQLQNQQISYLAALNAYRFNTI